MTLLANEMGGLGAALLPLVAALLFEELTFGGLVRLMLAPWPRTRKDVAAGSRSPLARGRKEHKHRDQLANGHPVCRTTGNGGGK